MRSLTTSLCFLFGLLSIAPVKASDDYKTALDAIAAYAEKICNTPPLSSSSDHFELNGVAKAGLKGLVTKIADLGIGGAATYKNEHSEGVLQKDLAASLTRSADCKERVSGTLVEKLINSPRALVPDHDPDLIYQHGVAVGHVTGAQPRLNESLVYFAAITDSQNLDRSRDFQYRKWVLHFASNPVEGSAGIQLTPQGPQMAVLNEQLCRIVGAATNLNSP
jgi:hypothetical protein